MAHRNRFDQQETERRHIEDFLRRKGIAGSVEYGDAPDAVLLVEGRRVGLEHCELTDQDLAANWPNISSLEGALRNELEKVGLGQGYSVGVGLNAAAPLFRKRSRASELAKRVARLALEQATALDVGTTVILNAQALAQHGLSDLLCIRITRLRHGSLLGAPDAFVSPGFWGPGELLARAAVRAKERRLPAYKESKALDEVWLLLVTGESWVQATDSGVTEWLQLESTFDEVYLLDTRNEQLQRLDEHAEE